MTALELFCRVMAKPASELLRSLRSFAGVAFVLLMPNMVRLGTIVGGGIAAASSFSSFFLCAGATLRSVTLDLRTNLPVPRLTLRHIVFLGLTFSSSWAVNLATDACMLLLDICFSRNVLLRDAIKRLPGEGMLRREAEADAVLTPDG